MIFYRQNIAAKIIFAFIFLNLIHLNAQSENIKNYISFSIEELLALKVTTASKTEQTLLESSSAMIIITDKMIAERGYHHLEEILHDLPGFDFNKSYGVNYSTIFMRGYRSDNSDRFIFLFDGIIENDIWKQTNWISRQYPVSQIKRIEVLFGPASALYGTNAFSGIINVITKEADEIGYFDLTAKIGSYGRKNVEISSGKMLDEDLGYNITLKFFSASELHNWDFMKIKYPENFSKDYLQYLNDPTNNVNQPMVMKDGKLIPGDLDGNPSYEDYSIHNNIYYKNLKFTFNYWIKNEYEGYWYNPFKRRGVNAEWFIGAKSYKLLHKINIAPKINLQSEVVYRIHGVRDSWDGAQEFYSKFDPGDPNTFGIVDNDPSTYKLKLKPDGSYGLLTLYNSEVYDFSIEEKFNYIVRKNLNLIYGIKYNYTDTQEDYNFSEFSSTIQKSPRHYKNTLGSYFQLIYKPSEVINFIIGGRFENQRDENKNGYDIFTPRIGFNIYPFNKLVCRLQYAEAFQEADDWHKFATEPVRPFPSPNLKPEKLRSFEISTMYIVNKHLLLSSSLYYNQVNDLISTVTYGANSEFVKFENKGNIEIYGYELSCDFQPLNNLKINCNISGAWNQIDQDGDKYLFGDIAPVKLNLGVFYRTENFSFYPKINYVAKKRTINHRKNNTLYPIVKNIDGYMLFSVNLNYYGIKNGIELNLKLENIFNNEYYNPGPRSADGIKYNAKVLQPGFNFMIGVTYALNKTD